MLARSDTPAIAALVSNAARAWSSGRRAMSRVKFKNRLPFSGTFKRAEMFVEFLLELSRLVAGAVSLGIFFRHGQSALSSVGAECL